MAEQWRIGTIRLATESGMIELPGWHNGTFAIDWRHCSTTGVGAYVFSHLVSGYSMGAMLANVEDVQAFVDRLTALGGWDVREAPAMKARIDASREELRDLFNEECVFAPDGCIMPPGDHGARARN
jgi:hypothetical protein